MNAIVHKSFFFCHIFWLLDDCNVMSNSTCSLSAMFNGENGLETKMPRLHALHAFVLWEYKQHGRSERKHISGDGNGLHNFVKHLGRLQMKERTVCKAFSSRKSQSRFDQHKLRYEIAWIFSASTSFFFFSLKLRSATGQLFWKYRSGQTFVFLHIWLPVVACINFRFNCRSRHVYDA